MTLPMTTNPTVMGLQKAKVKGGLMVAPGAVPNVIDAAGAKDMDMRATNARPGHRELCEMKISGRLVQTLL